MPLDIGRVTHLIDQMHRSEDDAGDPITAGFLLAADGASGQQWVDPSTLSGSAGVINVLDYGAVEDFSTDNATAFAAAVADMVDGCELRFPSVTGLGYKTSAGMSITKSGCLITGTGSRYGTRVHLTTSNTTAFSVVPSGLDGTRNQTNLIRGLRITGPGSATSGSGVYASSDCFLEEVMIAGFYNGIFWDTSTFYSSARFFTITNCVRGVVMNGTNNVTLDTFRITGNFGGGGLIGPVTDGVVMATALSRGLVNRIVNGSIEYFSGDGIRWNGGGGGVIDNIYFETQQSSTGHCHIRLGESNTVEALRIGGCYFQGDGTAGFKALIALNSREIVIEANKLGINGALNIDAGDASNGPWVVFPQRNNPAGTLTWPTGSLILDPANPPGAPTTADYLVGTANGSLSSEIVVGTTPGGELGGTWASPTVDTTHSGSSHAGVIATHEADTSGAHVAQGVSITDAGGHFTSTDVEGALQEVGSAVGSAGIGPLILASDHGGPIVFTDILQASDYTDLLYASAP